MADAEGTIKIRKMVDSDLAKVNEIDQALIAPKRATTWPFSFETYWSVYRPELAYVAELDGEVVGFLAGYIKPTEGTNSILRRADMQMVPPTRHQMVGWIEIIGVAPKGQYKGIGRQLIDTFSKECESRDAVVNTLVRRDDEFLSEFYENLGFKPWDAVIYYKPSKS
jgi:ribosomal protein S18 acetylase RimI-like enzyme